MQARALEDASEYDLQQELAVTKTCCVQLGSELIHRDNYIEG